MLSFARIVLLGWFRSVHVTDAAIMPAFFWKFLSRCAFFIKTCAPALPFLVQGGDKEGAKLLAEFTKDLCAAVRTNRIDPVSESCRIILYDCFPNP